MLQTSLVILVTILAGMFIGWFMWLISKRLKQLYSFWYVYNDIARSPEFDHYSKFDLVIEFTKILPKILSSWYATKMIIDGSYFKMADALSNDDVADALDLSIAILNKYIEYGFIPFIHNIFYHLSRVMSKTSYPVTYNEVYAVLITRLRQLTVIEKDKCDSNEPTILDMLIAEFNRRIDESSVKDMSEVEIEQKVMDVLDHNLKNILPNIIVSYSCDEEVECIPLLVSATVGQIINREKMSKILSYPNL